MGIMLRQPPPEPLLLSPPDGIVGWSRQNIKAERVASVMSSALVIAARHLTSIVSRRLNGKELRVDLRNWGYPIRNDLCCQLEAISLRHVRGLANQH